MKLFIILAAILVAGVGLWCCLAISKTQDEEQITTIVPKKDFPALRLLLDHNGVQSGEIQWAEKMTMPTGSVWVHGEIIPAPGLVRRFCVRLGHENERPGLEE